MNTRDAKRVAAMRIAMQVQNELDVGGYATDQDVRTDADEARLRKALIALNKELWRRAGLMGRAEED